MTEKKKAIILLYPPYENTNVSELEISLISLAKKNNLEIIKSICTKSNEQKDLLQDLINTVKEQSKPVTVIIKDFPYISFVNIILFSVCGTLEMGGLIDICIYEEEVRTYKKTCSRKSLKLHAIKNAGNKFLPVAQYNLDKLIELVPSSVIQDITG